MPHDATQLRQMYEAATGLAWDDLQGAQWLSERYENLDIYFKEPRLTKRAHVTLSDKIGWLSQQFCSVCHSTGSIHILPIRIRPESYQALNAVNKAAFKAAIAERFAAHDHHVFEDQRICLSLLFVCSRSRKVRDVDNMAKLVLDATKEVLFGDDRHVDHLSLIRIIHEAEEEFIYLRIGISFVNDHSDIAAPIMHHNWAGMPELRFEDYINIQA